MMSASGSYDTMPSNGGRGATMGPPGCPVQSPPVPFRWRRRGGLQGLSASWGDWRGQKVFLIRKRSLVRVLDRPLTGIQDFAAFVQISRFLAVCGSARSGWSMGPPWGHQLLPAGGKALLVSRRRPASARAARTPFVASVPSRRELAGERWNARLGGWWPGGATSTTPQTPSGVG